MRIDMRRRLCSLAQCERQWDTAIVGPCVDDRGERAKACIRAMAKRVIECSYDPEHMQMLIDGSTQECDTIEDYLRPCASGTLVLEATTLGFVEILLCCRAVAAWSEQPFSILYLEPGAYNAPRRATEVLARRDFELSEEVIGFRGVPGTTNALDESKRQLVVFLVGYEGQRLDRAIEELPLQPSHCHVVFGVPAFRPGWEMDSFSNNVRVMRERQINHGVSFCGAENPRATLNALTRLYESASGAEFFIAPIGTKPHAVGAALFSCLHDEVGMLYDHPQRKRQRSTDIGACHVFDIRFGVQS